MAMGKGTNCMRCGRKKWFPSRIAQKGPATSRGTSNPKVRKDVSKHESGLGAELRKARRGR